MEEGCRKGEEVQGKREVEGRGGRREEGVGGR